MVAAVFDSRRRTIRGKQTTIKEIAGRSEQPRVRVPQHIQDIAKKIVEKTMHVQASSKRLDEEVAALDAQRSELMQMLEDLKTEESQLEVECREWAEKRHTKTA